jgi:hypothetical protein
MLASSGGNVRLLLDELLDYTSSHPESETLIHRGLLSLRHALADSSALADLTVRSLPTPLPDTKRSPRKVRTAPPSDDLREFALDLQRLIGSERPLQLRDLIRLADETGPKHGKFPSMGDRRAKRHILEWLRANYEVLYPSLCLVGGQEEGTNE